MKKYIEWSLFCPVSLFTWILNENKSRESNFILSTPWASLYHRLSIDGKIDKKSAKSLIYRRSTDLSENFPIFSYQSSPRTGYKIWLKNRGFRVREIYIQWHKSKETPRTDPESTWSKKKKNQFFWFSLGVLYGFSRKSNEDEFS